MCASTSNAAVHVDDRETAAVEYWQTALQELCKNSPTPHAYAPQAYGLWSGQLAPPLLAPMPFFGGFFPGAYPVPAPVPVPSVKPETAKEVQTQRRMNVTAPSSMPPALMDHLRTPTPSIFNRHSSDDGWVKLDDETGSAVVCDDREMKRERRKQSNRESARRSRLRKQRECESLQKQVREMAARNQQLQGEIRELQMRVVELERENRQLKDKRS